MKTDQILDHGDLVNQLAKNGFTETEADLVLRESQSLGHAPEDFRHFQKHFINKDTGEVDPQKVKSFMHVNNVVMTLDSYEPVIADRADNTDNLTKLTEMENTIRLMHAAGYSANDVTDIINNTVRISLSGTPHPTETLSLNGTRLSRKLVHAAEVPQSMREDALKAVSKEILTSDDFAANKKATILNETDYSSECARIHNRGVNQLDREIEAIIAEVYNKEVDISSHTFQCSWAYDADGRPNAEGFAMMMQIATTTMDAFQDLNDNLEEAKSGNIKPATKAQIEELQEKVKQVIANLTPTYTKSREIAENLAACPPEQREALYRKTYIEDYHPLTTMLSKIYENQDNKRGLDFFVQTVGELDFLRKKLSHQDEASAFLIDDSFRTIKRCGFALEKGQTRHNDLVHIRMIDNMFASDTFRSLGILDETDLDILDGAGKLSDTRPQKMQHEFFQKVLEFAAQNGNRKEINAILEAANPLAFKSLTEGGNGYPEQEHAYNDRNILRSMYKYKFEEGVISDAQVNAPQRAKFLADLAGMPEMKHMPLNEDTVNLGRQNELVTIFNKEGGSENRETRLQKTPKLLFKSNEDIFMMRPASDAERNGGSFTRLQAIDQYRKMVRAGYESKVCVMIMLGGGQSLNRFGGDVSIVRRIAAQEIQEIQSEKREQGIPFDDYDNRALSMAMQVMYTEQGRTRRYASATPDQKRDDFASKMAQMLQDHMELKGDVPKNTFIDKKPKLSPAMQNLQRETADMAITEFVKLNNVVLRDRNRIPSKTLILDSFAEITSSPVLLPYQNNGARPAAGKSGGLTKLSGLRAIGKDQGIFSMQSFHTGFYSAGWTMKRFHEKMEEGKISGNDIRALTTHADWKEAIFSRDLIDAGRFNAPHLFSRLANDDEKKWNFDRAIEVGKTARIAKIEGQEKYLIHFDNQYESVTQEEAYLCKIYYDRAVFLAMTEAALTPKGQGVTVEDKIETILQKFRPENNSLEIDLGERTQAAFPLVVRDIENHRKNNAAYAVYGLVNDDLEKKAAMGTPLSEAIKEYGGEAGLRGIASGMRAGSLSHKSKWTGEDTYGMDTRRKADLKALIAAYTQDNNPAPENTLS